MAQKSFVEIPPLSTVTIQYSENYEKSLKEILAYGLDNWTAVLTIELETLIKSKIIRLFSSPNIYSILDTLVSTEQKTYRRILLDKFPYIIIYSVSGDKVDILNIIHEKINPKKHKTLIRQPRNKNGKN